MTSTIERPEWLPYDEFPFELKTIELPSGSVGYVDEGSGPTLLFVHAGLWSFVWRDTMVNLEDDFRTVAIDFNGFGLVGDRTDSPTIAGLSESLVDFVTELDLTGVTLIAHDLGGPVGLGAAASDPTRYEGLVLTNTFAWEPDQKALRGMLKMMSARSFEWFDLRTGMLPALTATRFGVGRHLSARGKAAFRGPYRDPALLRRFHRLMKAALSSAEHMALVEAATKDALNDLPVLTIFGARNDPFGFQERIGTTFPDHEGHTIPRSYHFPMMDEPDMFAGLIRDWVPRRGELVTSPDDRRGPITG